MADEPKRRTFQPAPPEIDTTVVPMVQVECWNEECANYGKPTDVPDNGFMTVCGVCRAVLQEAAENPTPEQIAVAEAGAAEALGEPSPDA